MERYEVTPGMARDQFPRPNKGSTRAGPHRKTSSLTVISEGPGRECLFDLHDVRMVDAVRPSLDRRYSCLLVQAEACERDVVK